MGARDLLDDLAGAGLSVRVDGGRLLVKPAAKLTDKMRAALRDAKAELLELLTTTTDTQTGDRPYKLAKGDADAAHAEPWDDATCARFVARVSWFLRLGIDTTDADDLAERSHLLDVQAEGQRLCLNCANLAGHASAGWRCRSARAAGVTTALPAEFVTLPQRCSAFGDALSNLD